MSEKPFSEADVAVLALRQAINNAIRAGASPGYIKSAVADQLFGIQYFGNGDVDVMEVEVRRTEEEARRAYHNAVTERGIPPVTDQTEEIE